MTKKKKKNKLLSSETKGILAILGVCAVILIIVILIQGKTRPSLEDLGFKKEETFYYKDDIQAYQYNNSVSLSQDITDSYNPHNVLEIIKEITRCDMSFMESFINDIISSKSYLEIDDLEFKVCDFSYSLNISPPGYDEENYKIQQYLYFNASKKRQKDILMDNFNVGLNDSYKEIPKYVIDLYKKNFKGADEQVSYAFNKMLSKNIEADKADLSIIVDGNSYDYNSFHKGWVMIYYSEYIPEYRKHDITVNYDLEYFESNYKKIIDEDVELLNIKNSRDNMIKTVEEYFKLFENKDYIDGSIVKIDKFTFGIYRNYNTYNLWYDYI